ncbi:hypothetical protein [Streptomyces sp. NPDC046374]|uniref:hypothetical protein n=1 Tax=unclassified Streptomyces TaxID=2593676 RepID=UPI0033E66230
MTKKTRVRVARIAASAVIAAGASLTAAGAAQAVGVSIGFSSEVNSEDPGCEIDPTLCPEPTKTTDPEPTKTTDPEPTKTTDPEPTKTTDPEPTKTTDPEPTKTTDPEPTKTSDPEPTKTSNPEPTKTSEPGPTDSPKPTGQPSTPGDGDNDNGAGTCTVDLDGAECVDNGTDTNNAGSQPVEQGKAKEELAETGAAETSFLIIGAATMIAGGIGFRMLPRLVGGGRTVA